MQKSKYQRRKRTSLWHDVVVHSAYLVLTAVMMIPFCCCWFLYYGERILTPFTGHWNWLPTALYALLYYVFCDLYGGFQIQITGKGELIYSQALSAFMSNVCLYFVTVLLARRLLSPLPLLAVLGIQILSSVLWTLAVKKIYFHFVPPLRTLLVGDNCDRLRSLIHADHLERRFDVIGSVSADEFLDKSERYIGSVDAVFLWDIQSDERNQILKFGITHEITAYLVPHIGDVLMSGAKQVHLFHLPVMVAEGYHPAPEYLFVKRIFDIIISAFALLVLSPVLLVTGYLIRKDGGPAIYRQRRLTQNGREFNILKLRSMRMDAEKDGVARLSTGEADDRITPVGRIIRRIRLDEIIQAVNVLFNSMSIVGPRPERPEIAEQYEKDIPEFPMRLLAKAGITGYAQVYGKYNTTPYEKLLMDLQYIMRPGLLKDLQIILATVKVLFMKESTEGVHEMNGSLKAVPDDLFAEEKSKQ